VTALTFSINLGEIRRGWIFGLTLIKSELMSAQTLNFSRLLQLKRVLKLKFAPASIFLP
jgi:hypothetical protein